jgi:hypothetical protein
LRQRRRFEARIDLLKARLQRQAKACRQWSIVKRLSSIVKRLSIVQRLSSAVFLPSLRGESESAGKRRQAKACRQWSIVKRLSSIVKRLSSAVFLPSLRGESEGAVKRRQTKACRATLLNGCPQPFSCRACEASLRALESDAKLKLVGQHCETAVPSRFSAELARRV